MAWNEPSWPMVPGDKRDAAEQPTAAAATRVLTIVGPTASGKSALALEIADRLPVEIVCCDSQQVYQGMDIGTGKPTASDRARVPHHLLDLVPPSQPFQAARWAALARTAIRGIVARGCLPVIVGGTGLYLRALLVGLFEAPPPEESIRRRHRDEALSIGLDGLYARLSAIDPETAARVQPRDLLRISRALELYEQTGLPMSVLRRRQKVADDIASFTVCLDPEADLLRARIGQRFDAMMTAGLLDETRHLRDLYGPQARALQALGYKQLGDHLEGRLGLDAAVTAAKAATAAYARRQRTWFRKEAVAVRVGEPPAADAVVAWWRQYAAGDAARPPPLRQADGDGQEL